MILMFSHNSSEGRISPSTKAPKLILTHICDKVNNRAIEGRVQKLLSMRITRSTCARTDAAYIKRGSDPSHITSKGLIGPCSGLIVNELGTSTFPCLFQGPVRETSGSAIFSTCT